MKAQLFKYWDLLLSSFWFLPSLMAAGAVVLAFATIAVDEAVTDEWLTAAGNGRATGLPTRSPPR